MYTQKKQCLKIKALLERLSGVQDIGFRNRKRLSSDLKKTYYKLCQEFTPCSLDLMAQCLNLKDPYDHATALHNIKQFNSLYKTREFQCNFIYEEAKKILEHQREAVLDAIKYAEPLPKTVAELNQKYLISSIKISELNHSIIRKKLKRERELEALLLFIQARLFSETPPTVSETYELKNRIKFALIK